MSEQPVIRWGDVASLLDGTLPEPPAPEILGRDDGNSLFYRGQVNSLFGEPESGKTWIALAAAAETLNEGGSAVIIDLDHNGMLSTVSRLVSLGASQDALVNFDQFRYVEPEDRDEMYAVVHELVDMRPDVVVLDSIGELLPALGLNSNSPDDFTAAHSLALKPLARFGACVIAIDHVAKNPDSASRGPTGTAAKSRAIGGVSLRVKVKEAFAPGRGGSAYISIRKDRHGGLRATSPAGDNEPLAGTFALHPDGYRTKYSIYAPDDGDSMPGSAPGEDVAALQALDPGPSSVRDVKDRLGWGSNRASIAYKVFRQQVSPEAEKQERSPFPTRGVRNEEHDPSPDEQTTFPVPEPFPRNEEQPESDPFPVPTPMCEEQGTDPDEDQDQSESLPLQWGVNPNAQERAS
ncbi:MAG: AAA family ATPase [Brevibacterium sp.]